MPSPVIAAPEAQKGSSILGLISAASIGYSENRLFAPDERLLTDPSGVPVEPHRRDQPRGLGGLRLEGPDLAREDAGWEHQMHVGALLRRSDRVAGQVHAEAVLGLPPPVPAP